MDNTTANDSSVNPWDEYRCSDVGLILPLINEFTWSIPGRATIYLLGLLWCFLAVAIIADVFMCSIERITSKTRTVRIADPDAPDGIREVEVRVWNDTVANLSLLALGTSAPEILLSVIEILGNTFVAGELGPGTIVGSAAFNLLVITGICIMSIPKGETRVVENKKVYAITAFAGIFAYVWLSIVLLAISPGQVELWEALITLSFFPLLILIAWLADRNFFIGRKKATPSTGEVGISLQGVGEKKAPTDEERRVLDENVHGDASLLNMAKNLSHEVQDDDGVTEKDAARIAAAKMGEKQSHSRNWYRINATRIMGGARKLIPQSLGAFQDLYDHVQLPDEDRNGVPFGEKNVDHSEGGKKAVVAFSAASCAVKESEKKVRVGLKRYGNLNSPIKVRVETINGTAMAGSDYIPFNEEVKFEAKEKLRCIYIEIVDDFEWEPDEFFFVKLIVEPEATDCVVGAISIMQITIIDDDLPGKLEFVKPSIVVKESARRALVPIIRHTGADGHVSVCWKTKDITAVDGKDYKGGEGEILFDHGETSKSIDITLFESNKAERDESFQIELTTTDGGAELGKISKTIITIVNDDEFNGLVSRIMSLTKASLDALALDNASWVTQFRQAMNVNGGNLDEATFLDYILHFLSFGWKVIFAFVPPAKYFGGWPAFLISLSVIGLLTAIIGDLAGIFGCLVNLRPGITAITLVALGTSMPDMFASKQAAVQERTADCSIGNVNGSNAVNVFLGLGLPWTMACIYWLVKTGEPFEVPVGDLGFTVVIFTCLAICILSILLLRRNVAFFGNAELGGPFPGKVITAVLMIFCWFVYVLISALKAYGVIKVQI